jgi:CheY-like chemotaxis protein
MKDEERMQEKHQNRYRVLLVEDNAFIRDMFAYGMHRFFQKRPGTLELEHVGDVATAWQRLSAERFDLLIVDYYLPAEDGAELIARIRREPRYARVPVVAMSVGGRDARDATMSAGANLFLDKPVVLRDLFETLTRLAVGGEG